MAEEETPQSLAQRLAEARTSWTSTLGDRSIQACYAVIGATWAVHQGPAGSVANLREDGWAVAAICVAVVYLGLNLLMLWIMGEWLHGRYRYSQESPETWKKLFDDRASSTSRFPWTKRMENYARVHHFFKVLGPGLAVVFLVLSVR